MIMTLTIMKREWLLIQSSKGYSLRYRSPIEYDDFYASGFTRFYKWEASVKKKQFEEMLEMFPHFVLTGQTLRFTDEESLHALMLLSDRTDITKVKLPRENYEDNL